MSTWIYEIDVMDIWRQFPLDKDFAFARDQIIGRFLASDWPLAAEFAEEFAEILTFEEFHQAWDEMYDAADIDRVWIKTF